MEPILSENGTVDRCYIIEKRRYNLDNNTTPFYINLGSDYNGIPEVLVLNLIFFVVGILLFTFLRKILWNYGRIAIHRVLSRKDLASDYSVFSHITAYESDAKPKSVPFDDDIDMQTERVPLDYYDSGYCGWFILVFRLRDLDILRKCGADAVQYAHFQRVIIYYLCAVTVFCLAVILPLNLSGAYITTNTQKFGATTIGNIKPNSPTLWIHCAATIVYLAFAYYCVRHFVMSVAVTRRQSESEALQETCTLMISKLPVSIAGRSDLIKKYFSDTYPEFPIVSVQFAFDVAKLADVERELAAAQMALSKVQQSGNDPLIAPHRCGLISFCCRNVHALTYYQELVTRLVAKRNELKASAQDHPLPFCLVTFENEDHALKVVNDFRRFWSVRRGPNRELRTRLWKVDYAPKATDIKWENLSVKHRLIKWILLNCAMFILLFFLSTPSMVMNVWFSIGHQLNVQANNDRAPFLAHVLPSCLLLASTSLLPYVIAGCEEWTYHQTKSGKNLALMTKTFIFMLFMVLILPSLGLTSGYSFIRYIFEDQYHMDRWECIFLPDNGAFFVNFLISSTLIGLSLELLRSAHLIYYAYQICKVSSKYELSSAKVASIFPFPFGLNYAYMLVIFAVTIVYSVVCPLIVPFGLLYFILKYFIDRYNMYFVYDSVEVSPKIHHRAANFLIGTCLLSQLVLLGFLWMRTFKTRGYPTMQIGFMIGACVLSTAIYAGRITLKCLPHWIRNYFTYDELKEENDIVHFDKQNTTDGNMENNNHQQQQQQQEQLQIDENDKVELKTKPNVPSSNYGTVEPTHERF